MPPGDGDGDGDGGGRGAPRGGGRVRGHRVPNARWLAPPEAALRRHPRFVALPEEAPRASAGASASASAGGGEAEAEAEAEAASDGDGDGGALRAALTRQHTAAWAASRARCLTGSSLAALCGLYEPRCGMDRALGLPKGALDRARLDGEAERLRGAALAGGGAAPARATSAAAAARAVAAFNAQLEDEAAVPSGDSKPARGAAELEAALLAARVGAGEVACRWGHAQEPAALLATLAALPEAAVCEVGLLRVTVDAAAEVLGEARARKLLAALPPLGASPDALLVFGGEGGGEAQLLAPPLGPPPPTPPRRRRSAHRRRTVPPPPGQAAAVPTAATRAAATAAAACRALAASAHVHVLPLELKSRSPFVASTEGLRGGSNHAGYRVCGMRSETPRPSVAAYHIAQAQLEALAAGAPATIVGYHAARGGIELWRVARDDVFVAEALALAADAIAAPAGARRSEGLVQRRRALAKRAASLARRAQRVGGMGVEAVDEERARLLRATGLVDDTEPFLRIDPSTLPSSAPYV